MPKLVLGPLLRYVGETQATVWVETDAAAQVEVLVSEGGARGRAPTFRVEGHHYALVLIDGLEPDRVYTYTVELDGRQVWPEAGPDGPAFPPSTIRTLHGDHPLRIAFGSCRVAAPHEPPWTLPPSADRKRGKGADALYAFALRMRDTDPDTWPDLLLLLGDQIYADDTSEKVQAFIRSRRDVKRPPGLEVADFEEYTRLYWEAWGDPVLAWLLSTVPTAMIFDDHDISDDWNTSAAWVEHMRGQSWWDERITSGLASYWLYQHLGNLSPDDLDDDPVWPKVREAGDATRVLREFAFRADQEVEGTRWSYTARLRPDPAGGDRLALRAGAGGRPPGDGRRRRVGLDRGAGQRRLRPPAAGHLAAVRPGPGHPRPGGLERGRDRRGLGPAHGLGGGEDPAGDRPGALGRLQRLLRPAGRADRGGGGRPPGPAARLGGGPVRRRPPHLPGQSSPSGASTPATPTARPGRRSARPCATRCRATSGPPTCGPSGARPRP